MVDGEIMNTFVESADYKFACLVIAGRHWVDVVDHAACVANWCARHIGGLAAQRGSV